MYRRVTSVNYKFFCVFIFCAISAILLFKVPDKNRLELDSQLYDRIAKNFAQNSDLSDPNNPQVMPVTAKGYPLFLGLNFKFFGINYKIIILLQILLSLLCFYLIYNICLLLFNTQVANISLFLSCINLGFIIHAQFILTEILLVTFLLLFLYFFSQFIVQKKFYSITLAGLFLGFSMLVKPVAIFFLPVPVMLIFFSNFFDKVESRVVPQCPAELNAKPGSARRVYRGIAGFLLTFLLPVSGYILFNYKKYSTLSLNPAGYENIYRYYLPRVLSCKDNISLEMAEKSVDRFVTDSNNINSRFTPELKNLLLQTVLNSPAIACYIWFKNVIKTYFGLYTTELKVLLNNNLRGGTCSYFKMSGNIFEKITNYINFGTNSRSVKLIGFLEIFYLLLQYLLIFFVFYSLFKNKQFAVLLLFLGFIIYFALITGHDGFGRYRMVLEPVLIILNSAGIAQLIKIFSHQAVKKYA